MFSFLHLYNFSSPVYETKRYGLRWCLLIIVKYPSVPKKLVMTVYVHRVENV